MPNGHDKNLVRLLITVAAFRARHGTWPSTIRMPATSLHDLRERVLTPESFSRISRKLEFIADDNDFVAMDGGGRVCRYGEAPDGGTDQNEAEAWLAPVRQRCDT